MSHRHLQALGITPWARRSLSQGASGTAVDSPASGQPGVLTINQPTAAVGTIILEWPNGPIGLDKVDPGGSLLSGILAALDQDCANFQILQLDATLGLPDLAAMPVCGSLVLCFVEDWPHQTGEVAGCHWLHLPSLTQMLADRQFKRTAWQQLKPLADRLK